MRPNNSSKLEMGEPIANPPDKLDLMIGTMKKIPGIGLLFALMSGISFAIGTYYVELVPNVDATVINIIKSIVQVVPFFPWSIIRGQNLFGESGERWHLVGRCFFGFFAFNLGYYALQFITMGDMSTILFSAPIWVSIFACVFLGEECGYFQLLIIAITMVGVSFVARPSFLFGQIVTTTTETFTAEQNLIGSGLALMASLSMSLTFISIRRIQKTSTSVVVVWFSVLSVLIGGLIVVAFKYVLDIEVRFPTTSYELWMIVLNGVYNIVGQICFVVSLKLEEAGIVSIVRTFDIVVAFLIQVTLLHQEVSWMSVTGAIIVCVSVLISCLRKLYITNPNMFKLSCFKGKD